MAKTVRNSNHLSVAFRLTPLMMALALISPLNASAAELDSGTTQLDTQSVTSHQFHRDHVIGTSLDVVITGVNKTQAQVAMTAIENEISRLDQILSTWRSDSEISALNKNHNINASPELIEVISACESMRQQTCGAFDARLGQLIQAWEKSQGIVSLDQNTRDQIISHLDAQSVNIDAENMRIKKNEKISFAPDAYAKGYIVDRAFAVARQAVPEMQGILVDIGGDMRVWGQAPQRADQSGWKIGVQAAFNHFDNVAPDQILNLNDQAIAFSGQGYRNRDGQSHLLNPKTGLPLNHIEQCVVVGTCAADADALATALAAMSPTEGLAFIESLIGYESKLTTTDGQVYQSRGWNNLVQTDTQAQFKNVASSSTAKWPTGYQAVLDVVIPKIAVDNYRAPYVSVWVTDSNKRLVRTLAVWGKDERWINSNYVWWRRYGRQMPQLDAVAKPSRHPGQYKLAWDGKDESGKAVPAGQYQIHIETTREHGDHSYQTMNLEIKAQASNQALAAQKEIGAIKLNFQKVN